MRDSHVIRFRLCWRFRLRGEEQALLWIRNLSTMPCCYLLPLCSTIFPIIFLYKPSIICISECREAAPHDCLSLSYSCWYNTKFMVDSFLFSRTVSPLVIHLWHWLVVPWQLLCLLLWLLHCCVVTIHRYAHSISCFHSLLCQSSTNLLSDVSHRGYRSRRRHKQTFSLPLFRTWHTILQYSHALRDSISFLLPSFNLLLRHVH